MAITDNIRLRKSVRSYSGTALNSTQIQELKNFLANTPQPLGGQARIEMVSNKPGNEPVKLGTYGVISGASDFLVLLYEEGPLAAANAGYLFEKAVLYCTEKGLGTCWLGGTFRKSGFASQVNATEKEVMRIVSPVGYPAEKVKFRDKFMRAAAGSDKRKPFEQLFFENSFSQPLQPGGVYTLPLEMVRLAPSASNSQPWRAIAEREKVHFYYRQKSPLTDIDMGIALCHFELTFKETGIKGGYSIQAGVPVAAGMNYIISWVTI